MCTSSSRKPRVLLWRKWMSCTGLESNLGIRPPGFPLFQRPHTKRPSRAKSATRSTTGSRRSLIPPRIRNERRHEYFCNANDLYIEKYTNPNSLCTQVQKVGSNVLCCERIRIEQRTNSNAFHHSQADTQVYLDHTTNPSLEEFGERIQIYHFRRGTILRMIGYYKLD